MTAPARETWLTTQEAADLLEVTPRAVRKSISNGNYRSELRSVNQQGGKALKLALSSLPTEAQIRHARERQSPASPAAASIPDLDSLPAWQRRTVGERYLLLSEWFSFEAANRRHAGKVELRELYCKHKDLAPRTLARWEASYKKHGWQGLASGYGNRRGNSKLDVEGLSFIEANFLKSDQPSAHEVYNDYAADCAKRGVIPCSYQTVLRYINNTIPRETKVLYRLGPDAFNDLCLPYLERDYTVLKPMEAICGDHHILDLFVKGPTGKLHRPHLTMWSDIRSRRPVGWVVSLQGCGATILYSLRRAIDRFGKPEVGYIDNGMDYKGAQMTAGGRRRWVIDEDQQAELAGIWLRLGIKPVFAEPYHGQSKPIERQFRDIKDHFSRELDAFCGGRPSERPHDIKERTETGRVYTLAELEELIGRFIEEDLINRPHTGHGMDGRTPDEVFHDGWVKRRMDREELRLLLMKARPATVGRQGVRWNHAWYRSDELAQLQLQGQKVIARYDPADVREIYLYDATDRFLCAATIAERSPWFAGATTERDIGAIKREKKLVKEIAKAGKVADAILYELDEAARLGLNPDGPQPDEGPRVIEPVRTTAAGAVKALNQRGQKAVNQDFNPEDLEALADSAAQADDQGAVAEDEEYLDLFDE